LHEMRDAEYLIEQADALTDLIDIMNEAENVEGNAAILSLYEAVDPGKFAQLMVFGKSPGAPLVGESQDAPQALVESKK